MSEDVPEDAIAAVMPVAVTPADPAGPAAARPPQVLIVDDDPATRNGIAELLRMAGCRCIAVGSFVVARDLLKTSPPDVLVTDVRLGEHNGLQLIVGSPHPVRAIVISGFDDPVLKADALRAGATYIAKPVNPSEIVGAVRQKLLEVW